MEKKEQTKVAMKKNKLTAMQREMLEMLDFVNAAKEEELIKELKEREWALEMARQLAEEDARTGWKKACEGLDIACKLQAELSEYRGLHRDYSRVFRN